MMKRKTVICIALVLVLAVGVGIWFMTTDSLDLPEDIAAVRISRWSSVTEETESVTVSNPDTIAFFRTELEALVLYPGETIYGHNSYYVLNFLDRDENPIFTCQFLTDSHIVIDGEPFKANTLNLRLDLENVLKNPDRVPLSNRNQATGLFLIALLMFLAVCGFLLALVFFIQVLVCNSVRKPWQVYIPVAAVFFLWIMEVVFPFISGIVGLSFLVLSAALENLPIFYDLPYSPPFGGYIIFPAMMVTQVLVILRHKKSNGNQGETADPGDM